MTHPQHLKCLLLAASLAFTCTAASAAAVTDMGNLGPDKAIGTPGATAKTAENKPERPSPGKDTYKLTNSADLPSGNVDIWDMPLGNPLDKFQ